MHTISGKKNPEYYRWMDTPAATTGPRSLDLRSTISQTLTQADWKKLDSFHLRCQQRILHISWYDFVSNDEVCVVLACSTSPTSSAKEDWVSLDM